MNAQLSDLYPLAPVQRGMLYHALNDPQSSSYVEQYSHRLEGTLDEAAFRSAWAEVCRRNAVLRSAFEWEELDRPLQAVFAEVPLPLAVEDWRERSGEAQRRDLARLEQAERARGFDLAVPPLFRLRLLRLDDECWQFIWTHHHVLLDGWSVGIVLHELASLYGAARRGVPAELPPPVPYREFVAATESQDLAAAHDYWSKLLDGFTEPTSLGIAGPHDGQGAPNARLSRSLSEELTDQLNTFARTHRLTLDTVLSGAWAVVLGRYGGVDEVVFGVTSSGRSGGLVGVERMVGLLINTLPVRVRLGWELPVVDWLVGVQELQVVGREFESTPLDRVQVWSQVGGGRSLFDSILVVENYPIDESRFRDASIRPSQLRSIDETNYPLALRAAPGERLRLDLIHDGARVSEAAAGQLLRHLQAVLAGFVAGSTLAEVPMLSAREQAQLASWATPQPVPVDPRLAYQRVFAHAAEQPSRPAVSYEQQRLTYGELVAGASQLARRLRDAGVGPGVLVGVCLPRGLELVTAMLGVAAAGGVAVPMDVRHPASRIGYVLHDADVAVLVTATETVATFQAEIDAWSRGARAVICLDHEPERQRLAQLPATPPAVEVSLTDPAYVIYTSGSTGVPKGVVVEHGQLVRLFDATVGWFGFGVDDVWSLFHSVAFDFSVWELWGALVFGGRLVVVPDGLTRDPVGFRGLLLVEGVTVLCQTPSAFRSLMFADVEVGGGLGFGGLRVVVFGGEVLEVSGLGPWFGLYGGGGPWLVNMYGITETTVHVTFRRVGVGDVGVGVGSPVGVVIPDLGVRLLDGRGWLVPVGVVGEVFVGGAGVARGYLGRPELTAERFVANPGREPGVGGLPAVIEGNWYRSGDLARWLPNGELEFLGRADDQVKIRGHRIELGEVESNLVAHPSVRESAVVARQTEVDGHRQLVAYVVPATTEVDPQLAAGQLRAWLADRLPDYAVPAAFVTVSRLPLTVNGKLDRAALPAPRPDRADEAELVAPRNEVEKVLVQIWSEVLGVERVGTTDNFFALGGDSILTIQVVSRAGRQGVRITPAQLFEEQTIAALARVAERSDAATRAEQREVSGELAPTPVQRWFHQLGLRHPAQWNLSVLVTADRPVPADQLDAALQALLRHHDQLRLRIELSPGPGPDPAATAIHRIAAVAQCDPVPVTVYPLTGLDPEQRAAAVAELAAREQAGLDLAAGPMLRAALLRTDGEPDQLLLVAHHLVTDAVSWRVLLADLHTALDQLDGGGQVTLPAKTTDARRWAAALTTLAGSDQTAAQARWWLDRMPAAVAPLPRERDPGQPHLAGDTALVTLALESEATEALQHAAHQAYRTRTDELLLAALARAVTEWTGEPGLLVDVEGHGRDVLPEVDVARTVGWFTTFTPSWLDLATVDPDDPGQLVKTVKEQLREVRSRAAAFGLARWLRDDPLAGQLAALPRAEVSFNYLGRLDDPPVPGGFRLAGAAPGADRHPADPRPYLLDVTAGVRQGRLELYLAYSSRLYDQATMTQLAQRCLAALQQLITHCLAPDAGGPTPSDFPLAQVTSAQLDQLASERPDLVDLYPLSPLQRGLLFHTLANPRSGVYFEQFSMRLDGPLDRAAFARAWRDAMTRHGVLRSGIAWAGLSVPHWCLQREVPLPLSEHDWRELTGSEQQARLEVLLTEDRARGFALGPPPLMRLHLVRLGEQSWHLVWSHHHLIVDGWSVALLLQEVFDTYEALRHGDHPVIAEPRPYRDYLAHLAQQDLAAAEAYWRRVLAGFTEPTPLRAGHAGPATERADTDYDRARRRLCLADSQQLREFVQTHRLTVDTLLHAAWALVLARRSQRDEVVFGVTSSGRPPALSGVEGMVGLFVNTLPARVRTNRDQSVLAWLTGLLREQAASREFEHAPLDQIRGWSAVPAGRQLFDSIRVLENYPMDSARFHTGNVSISAMRTFEQTNYALSFVVVPDEELLLQVWFDARQFPPEVPEALLAEAEAYLCELVADPTRPLGAVIDQVASVGEQPGLPTPATSTLPEAVAYWARTHPHRVALSGPGGQLTYQQLDARANQLAHRLGAAGVRPQQRVSVPAAAGTDSVVAMLAVLKCGAACVLTAAPGSPQRAGLTEPAPDLCLTVAGEEPLRPDPPTISLDLPAADGFATTAPPVECSGGQPALIVALDGGGPPQSVTLTHRALLSQVSDLGHEQVLASDVVGALAPSGTDTAAWEWWVALANGAQLLVAPGPDPDTAQRGQWLRTHGASVLAATAPQLQELMDEEIGDLRAVRLVFLQGALTTAYGRRLRAALPSLRLVRGSRLEVSRVEHQLRALPAVGQAAVRPTPDGHRLIGYVVPQADGDTGPDQPADELAERHVREWRTLYDQTYAAGADPADPTFNIVGWNSSYTGAALPAEAMREWRERTVERLAALRPRQVLEIGCGTGLLTLPLLAHCQRYVGTDFSAVCLDQLHAHLATGGAGDRGKVTLLERAADDFTELAAGSFDLVVLNSVAQYFPDPGYLTRVLDGALRVCAPGGAVVLGDLRHYGLLEAFQTSVELHRATADTATEELRRRVRLALDSERELLIDPGFFLRLAGQRPEIGAVEITPKRGRHDSELTRYRYEAVLYRRGPVEEPGPVAWYDWRRDVLSQAEIGWLLETSDAAAVGVTGVPNARLATDVAAAALLAKPDRPGTVAELREAASRAPRGLDPDELYALAESRGWSVTVSWAAARVDGSVDALFTRAPEPVPGRLAARVVETDGLPTAPLTNVPLRSAATGEWERRVQAAARETLPAYLSVDQVVVVPALPRTDDGEIDYAALALPEEPLAAAGTGERVPARSADELRLARIWERALAIPAVDVRTSFFDLGGDSLLAIRVVGEAARVFGREIPMAALLQDPTVEGMATALRADRGAWSPLVEITAGEATPFFCVHPAGGNVLCYAELARLVGADQPFYGLQARGIDGDEPPYDDIPTMATRYLREVRRVQPSGPYLLGGWSMGGHIAYEMAQQLAAAGESTALLVLIDTPTPELVEQLPDEVTVLVRLLEGVVPLDHAHLASLSPPQRLRHVLGEAERAHAVPPGMDLAQAQQLLDVHATHVRAVRAYQPRPYRGPVALLKAAQSDIAVPDYGWGPLLAEPAINVVEVPGNHETVVWPPNVQRLAEALQAQLSAARAPGSRASRRPGEEW